jgi:hypothetical protein
VADNFMAALKLAIHLMNRAFSDVSTGLLMKSDLCVSRYCFTQPAIKTAARAIEEIRDIYRKTFAQ